MNPILSSGRSPSAWSALIRHGVQVLILGFGLSCSTVRAEDAVNAVVSEAATVPDAAPAMARAGGDSVASLSAGSGAMPAAVEASTGLSANGIPMEVYGRSSVTLYLATGRTMGGLGGGMGARCFLKPWLFGQADLAIRMMIGRVGELRIGMGAQRDGFYSPSAILFASALFGDQLSFFLPDVAPPPQGPAIAVGLEVHPFRFRKGGLYASAFNFGIGAGLEGLSLPLEVQVGILELGSRF